MEKLSELYQKALSVSQQESLSVSINDLLIKDLNGEVLSDDEAKALSKYIQFRNQLLSSAKDDNFSDKIKKLRVIANFTNWREFL
jgi:hypothetical protein